MGIPLVLNAEVFLPNQSEWGVEQTKRIKYLSESEATDLMNEYDLDNEARVMLWPFVGTLRDPHRSANLSAPPSPPPVRTSSVDGPSPVRVAEESGQLPRSWRPPNPDRPLWLAAAWLCGASYSVLAMLEGVSEQAIQQSVTRSMPSAEERHTHRLGYRLPSERIEELKVRYYENVLTLRGMTPVECAKWLTQEDEE